MQDKRFIFILLSIALPVAGWLTFEYLTTPNPSAKHSKLAKAEAAAPVTPESPPAVPAAVPGAPPAPPPSPAPAVDQIAPASKSEPAKSAAPPRPVEAPVPASPRKSAAKAKAKDAAPAPLAAPEQPPAPTPAPVAPAPPKPHSPEELCAKQSNFITRGLCEIRACATAEWTNHPFCVKRREIEERNRPGANLGGGN
jgi:hypothetical protein